VTQAAALRAPGQSAQRVRLGAALVSVALFGANALSYLLNMVATRALDQEVYGALGSLLALVVIGTVPAMGMQTVAALHVAAAHRRPPRHPRPPRAPLTPPPHRALHDPPHRPPHGPPRGCGISPLEPPERHIVAAEGVAAEGAAADRGVGEAQRQLLTTGLGGAVAVGALVVLATPLLVALLHLPDGWPVVWLGLSLAPLTLLGVFHGILQGHRRFATLALLVGIEGVAKVGGALAGLLALHTTAATLAGMAAGSALTAAAGWWICGLRRPARATLALAGRVLHASQAILGLVLLVNLDIVLARHTLPAAQAGDYAVGVIITKIAYWLPQAVAVIVLPRFVDERHRRRAVPVALAVIALLDIWVVLPALLTGGTLIRLIGGPGYGAHAGAAWLFALLGSLLALVQLLLFSRIASADRRSAMAVWAAVALEVALVTRWLHGSVTQVATAALASVTLLVLAGLAIEYRSARRPLAAEALPPN
jgi:O-antigen/teichoic acid export membrane protein